jgi:8-oxo-dGTP pyrophosphatase MutT (NUDIX family)
MEHKNLLWKEKESKKVFNCRVFSVREKVCVSPDEKSRTYMVLDAADWAIVVPVINTPQGKKFVMVRQWRHGAEELSLEFPGGVIEQGEKPNTAAARELREETAYAAGKITKLGEYSPNPAIMSNRVHFFLAEDLQDMGKQNLDEDEYVETELVNATEVFLNMGHPPYIHALMGTALSLYIQKTAKDSGVLPINL